MASAPQTAVASDPIQPPDVNASFFTSPDKRTMVLSLLLILLTLIAYNPISNNNFVKFDDPAYITANQHVRSGVSWETFKWAFRSTEQANWHPLTWISHALDWQLFHQNPIGHHYTNVLLQALTTVLLFLFLQAATGFPWRSAMVAALFAIHPMNVESVAWASERKSALSLFFFALMLLAYRRYTQKPGLKFYSLTTVFFALGLMSKPLLVTAPFLLFLLDYWPLERTRTVRMTWLILEKLPLLVMSAASCVVTVIAQKAGGAIHHDEFLLSGRLQNAIVAYVRYMGKVVWPSRLAAFYPHAEHLPAWQIVGSFVLLALITTGVLMRRQQRYLMAGWFWFLGTMIPMIGLVQVGEQAMADRYAYLPFLGLFIAVVWEAADWSRTKSISAMYLGGGACLVLIALGTVTHHQIGYWKNTKTLWTHTLAVTGPNFVAEDSLGAELIEEDNLAQAVVHLQRAVTINPRDAFSRLDLGVCEKRAGNTTGAIANYEAALQLSSDRNLRATAYGNLGSIARMNRNYTRALSEYESALQLLPDYAMALTGMGLIAEKSGDAAGASGYFGHATLSSPSDAEYLLLAQALARAGRQHEAQAALSKAQSLSQNWNATVDEVNHLLEE